MSSTKFTYATGTSTVIIKSGFITTGSEIVLGLSVGNSPRIALLNTVTDTIISETDLGLTLTSTLNEFRIVSKEAGVYHSCLSSSGAGEKPFLVEMRGGFIKKLEAPSNVASKCLGAGYKDGTPAFVMYNVADKRLMIV